MEENIFNKLSNKKDIIYNDESIDYVIKVGHITGKRFISHIRHNSAEIAISITKEEAFRQSNLHGWYLCFCITQEQWSQQLKDNESDEGE